MLRFMKTSLFSYIPILYNSQYICEIIVIDLQLEQKFDYLHFYYLYNKQIHFKYMIDRSTPTPLYISVSAV